MFEHRKQPLLPQRKFTQRQLIYILVAFGMIVVSVILGMLGYHYFENMPWVDTLYSGIIFLVVVGVIFVPLYHRFLHRFHLEREDA